MRIIVVQSHGQAGPYVMMDFADAFESLGHETVTLQMKDVEEAIVRDGEECACRDILNWIKSQNADFAMGYGMTAVLIMKLADGELVNVFEDAALPYCSICYDSPILDQSVFRLALSTLGSKLHHLFIWDRYYVEEMKKLGFEQAHYLPIAANTRRFVKAPDTGREQSAFKSDVSFVGCWSLKRELVLRRLKGFEPAIYGYFWENASPEMENFYRGRADNRMELPFIYNYSKVNLNITMEQGITSLNMRVFDTLASEGFLITDFKEDCERLFDVEKELVCYRSLEELPQLVSYYLRHDKERREKARLGRRRVLREHSYKKRVEQIINTLSEYQASGR